MRDLLRLSFRVFHTRPLRTSLTILGMAIGIGTVLFLTSLGYGLQAIFLGSLISTQDSLITIEAFYSSESSISITQDSISRVAAFPETGEVSPIAEFPAEIIRDNSFGNIIAQMVMPNFFRLSGLVVDQGTVFGENDPAAVLSNQAARLLDIESDIPTALTQDILFKVFYPRDGTFEVVETPFKTPLKIRGIINDDLRPPFAIIPLAYAEQPPPSFTKILVKARDIDQLEALRTRLVDNGYLTSTRVDLVNQAQKILRVMTIVLSTFGVTALVVSAIGMFNTMIIGFMERIHEVGIIKALGATDKDIKRLFLMESLVLGFTGGLGGIILGMGTSALANFGLNTLALRFGGKPFTLFVTPLWFLGFILIVSAIIGLCSGYMPARRATKLSPREAFFK